MRTQLYIGKEAGLIESSRAQGMIEEATAIGRMLGALIGKLSRSQA